MPHPFSSFTPLSFARSPSVPRRSIPQLAFAPHSRSTSTSARYQRVGDRAAGSLRPSVDRRDPTVTMVIEGEAAAQAAGKLRTPSPRLHLHKGSSDGRRVASSSSRFDSGVVDSPIAKVDGGRAPGARPTCPAAARSSPAGNLNSITMARSCSLTGTLHGLLRTCSRLMRPDARRAPGSSGSREAA